MPWHVPGAFDHASGEVLRRLIAVRRKSAALRRGSMRWAFADDDRMAFLRETADETVLVLLARGGATAPRFRWELRRWACKPKGIRHSVLVSGPCGWGRVHHHCRPRSGGGHMALGGGGPHDTHDGPHDRQRKKG